MFCPTPISDEERLPNLTSARDTTAPIGKMPLQTFEPIGDIHSRIPKLLVRLATTHAVPNRTQITGYPLQKMSFFFCESLSLYPSL